MITKTNLFLRLITVLGVVGFLVMSGAPGGASAQGGVVQVGNTITVTPTGGDDTPNLTEAFALAAAAGPDSVIQLVEGIYYVDFMDIENFNGTLKGMGKNKTFITPIEALNCEQYWALITFRHGSFIVSDLSFRVTSEQPCNFPTTPPDEVDAHWLNAMVQVAGAAYYPGDLSCDQVQPDVVNANFERVGFIGAAGDGWNGTNLTCGLRLWGEEVTSETCNRLRPLTGSFTMKDSTFENAYNPLFGGLENGSLSITHNTFSGLISQGIALLENSNSTVEVSDNDISSAGFGLLVQNNMTNYWWGGDNVPNQPSEFLISRNTFHVAGAWNFGIILLDLGPLVGLDSTIKAVITKNTFLLDGSDIPDPTSWDDFQQPPMGVVGQNVNDAVVTFNKFEGSRAIGIYITGGTTVFEPVTPFLASGWLVKGNNLEKLKDFYVDPDGVSAVIFLTEYTSHNTIMGVGRNLPITDYGIDNLITGFTKAHGNHTGWEIKEAMEFAKQLRKELKHHH